MPKPHAPFWRESSRGPSTPCRDIPFSTLLPRMRCRQGRFPLSAGHEQPRSRAIDSAQMGNESTASMTASAAGARAQPARARRRPTDRRAAGPAPARGDRQRVARRRRLADPAASRCSPRASTCASASTRGRCAAASCPTATRPSSRRSQDLAFERIDLRDGATLERDRPYLVPLIEELRLPDGDPREGEPEELDRAPRRVHARAHRPQPPLRRDRCRLSRQALPGGRAAHVRDPRADGPRAQPGAADRRRRAAERSRAARAARRGFRCSIATRSRSPPGSCRSPTGCSSASTCPARPEQHRRLPRQEEQPADRSHARRRAALAGLLGARAPGGRAGGSCSSPRSSTCCSRPRASASRRPTPPRCSPTTRRPASCARTTPGSSTPASATRERATRTGSRAALEVRARDVSFMVEHRQPVCKLAFERMAERARRAVRRGRRLQLPGPGDDAQQALPRPAADDGRLTPPRPVDERASVPRDGGRTK